MMMKVDAVALYLLMMIESVIGPVYIFGYKLDMLLVSIYTSICMKAIDYMRWCGPVCAEGLLENCIIL